MTSYEAHKLASEAAARLLGSERGTRALRELRVWIDRHAAGLDAQNSDAALLLFTLALNGSCSTVLDAS